MTQHPPKRIRGEKSHELYIGNVHLWFLDSSHKLNVVFLCDFFMILFLSTCIFQHTINLSFFVLPFDYFRMWFLNTVPFVVMWFSHNLFNFHPIYFLIHHKFFHMWFFHMIHFPHDFYACAVPTPAMFLVSTCAVYTIGFHAWFLNNSKEHPMWFL